MGIMTPLGWVAILFGAGVIFGMARVVYLIRTQPPKVTNNLSNMTIEELQQMIVETFDPRQQQQALSNLYLHELILRKAQQALKENQDEEVGSLKV